MAETWIIDGKAVGEDIRHEIAEAVLAMTAAGHRPPGLAVILVGENPASKAYVGSKAKACGEAGFHSAQIDLDGGISESELIAEIVRLNADPRIDGILVQLPLPAHISEQRVILAIDPDKDVDGLHPLNAGRLASGLPGFVPCTPLGVQQLLIRGGFETAGRIAAVIGRSNLVGRPLAQLLSAKGRGGDATVILCHSRTRDIAAVARQADILVAAIGKANFVTADMVKPGAVVIDVGINRIEDPTAKRGYRLVGDVDFEAVHPIAGAITPVPGGVGPLTIAMLLGNTLDSARRRLGLSP